MLTVFHAVLRWSKCGSSAVQEVFIKKEKNSGICVPEHEILIIFMTVSMTVFPQP